MRDNSQTEPEKTAEEGYHLTPDLVSKAKAMIADSKQVAPNPYADQFAQSSTNSARSMTDDKSLGLVFWRVLDALDYWLTLTQLRILDALCVEELEITADE